MTSVCTYCAAEIDKKDAVVFQEYSLIIPSNYGVSEDRYWEEDPGAPRKSRLSDKVKNSALTLCPACADSFRIEIKEERRSKISISLAVLIVWLVVFMAVICVLQGGSK